MVFDGEDLRANAIDVEADGVTLENMSAHNFTANGFYWAEVEGFAGRYLTVWNVGLYGIYAISSRGGIMEQSYVSGAADAAFYIGECQPCDATIRNVTATLSAVGYSGTNAGGNLVVEDSKWLLNSVGILPNSFDVGLEPPPQRDAIFRRNEVVGSGTVVTPRTTPLGGYHGVGIGIAGGQQNLVQDNDVRGSTRYGIAVFTAIDRTSRWYPGGTTVTGTVSRPAASRTSPCRPKRASRTVSDATRSPLHSRAGSRARAPGRAPPTPRWRRTSSRHHRTSWTACRRPVLRRDDPRPRTAHDALRAVAIERRVFVARRGGRRARRRPVFLTPPRAIVLLGASVLVVALFAVVILLVAFRVVPRRR